MAKILVADKLEKSALDGLGALGAEVIVEPDLQDDALGARLGETQAEVLVVRGTKVTGPMIEGSNLKLIVRAGAGYNTIDVASATSKGAWVTNCPGKNAKAVAELAIGLMVALDRFIPDNVSSLREGKWNKKGFSKARGLAGRTIGLIGMGNIGRETQKRAEAFEMNVIAFSRHGAEGVKLVSLEELAAQADVVSVHTSLTPETKGLLGEAFFSKMKPGSLFINTSRAEVVDQTALLKAIEEKGIRAALDTFENEPTTGEGEYSGPLRDAASVYCTHHIGASTEEAQEAVATETVRIVAEFLKSGTALNAVNEVG